MVRLCSGKTWMKQHNNNQNLTRTFIRSGNRSTSISPNDIGIIANYIYNYYGPNTYSGTSFEALRLRQLLNTPNMSSNTYAFSSCDWATCKTCLYLSQVSLEAVSTGTWYTWSNILGLETVFSIDIFLHPFMPRLYFPCRKSGMISGCVARFGTICTI